jgi:site-specific recombinase XerD
VTSESIRNLLFYGRTERRWQTNTYVVFYKSLKVFLRWCASKGLIADGLMAGIEVPKIEKRLPVRLGRQEALRLLEIVNNYPYQHKFLRYRNHAIFSMLIYTGLRKQELLNLRLTDVDLENLTLFVRQGKGAKDRFIPITYTLAQTLRQYIEERRKSKKTCPEFFTSLTHNMGLTDKGLNNLVYKMREVLKIPFSSHKLRHTFATLMLEGGCDLFSLSKMMGHNDLKTTAIYLSATTEHLRTQMTKHPLNEISLP